MWGGILLRMFSPSHSDCMDGEALTEKLFLLLLVLFVGFFVVLVFFFLKGPYELRAKSPPSESSANWSAWILGEEIVLI